MPILKLFLFFIWIVLLPFLVGLPWSAKDSPSPSEGRGHFHSTAHAQRFSWRCVLPSTEGRGHFHSIAHAKRFSWRCVLPSTEGRGHFHPLLAFAYGTFIVFALFEILAIPMVFLKCSLRQLSTLWAVLTLVLAAFSVWRSVHLRRFRPSRRSATPSTHRDSDFPTGAAPKLKEGFSHLKSRVSPLFLVVWLCIFLQAAYVTVNQHIDDDDAFYVATAVTAVETNTLMEYNPYTGELYKSIPTRYVLAAWPLYLAVLSNLCAGLHPTLIAHLLLPGLIVLFAYLIYALIARELFPDDIHRQDLFLLIVALVISFSGFSIYSSGVFLITRGWQGKALVAAIIQPALFYLCRRAMKKGAESPGEKTANANADSPNSAKEQPNQEKSFPESRWQHRPREASFMAVRSALAGLCPQALIVGRRHPRPSDGIFADQRDGALPHEDNWSDWFLIFCAVTTACMFSSMGVVLSVIPVSVYALVYGISQKEWKIFPRALLACLGALVCGVIYLLL